VTVSAGVLANDTDPNSHPLKASLVTDASDGNLTFDANGWFDYTPDANYFGKERFTYKAYDGLTASQQEANVFIFVYSIMGDINVDGDVDDDDLSLLLAHWGQDTCWGQGEISGDDVVDDDDLSLLLSHWGGKDPNTGEPNEIAATYQSTEEIDGNDYKVHDLFFTTDTDWTISTIDLQLTSGSLYQDPYGTSTEPNPAWFQYFPDLEWDTYLTGPGGYTYPPNVIVGSIDDANLIASWFDSTYYGPGTYKLARITLSTDADGAMTAKCSQESDANTPASVTYEFDIEDGNIVPAQ
jgi:hypothetical protein